MPRGGIKKSTWKKGEKPPVQRPKGSKNKRTLIKEAIGIKNWNELTSFVENNGIEKCVKELTKLKGRSYVYAFMALTEFVKPKLARTELVGDPDKPIQVEHDLTKLSKDELRLMLELTKKAGGE
jgi:hypothetical protein